LTPDQYPLSRCSQREMVCEYSLAMMMLHWLLIRVGNLGRNAKEQATNKILSADNVSVLNTDF
jgi:hypothetical protein